MDKPILIGLAGKARSGKDTAAEYLRDTHGLATYALAGPLKQMLTSVFGEHFHTGDREAICPETGVSYRVMMQLLGTEWGRRVNPDIWVNLMLKQWADVQRVWPVQYDTGMQVVLKPGGPAVVLNGMVVSDVRFDNEAEAILDAGGIVVNIVRHQGGPIGLEGHASEAGVHPRLISHEVNNGGSLKDLHRHLDRVAENFLWIRQDHGSTFV
jgi:hypothetical protein